MREITLFDQDSDSNLALSIFARLARGGKRVLMVDMRLNKKKRSSSMIGLDFYHCINENSDPRKYITILENNLDLLKGHSDMNYQEFNYFFELFKLDYFEKKFKNMNYDYVVFWVSPYLNLLTTNALFSSNEIMALIDADKSGMDFAQKLSRFTYHYNKIYSKELLISKIIPKFEKEINTQTYTYLISEFTSKLISYPLINIRDKNLKNAFAKISFSIMDDEKVFDPAINTRGKQKMINEYLEILSNTSTSEVPLTKFN